MRNIDAREKHLFRRCHELSWGLNPQPSSCPEWEREPQSFIVRTLVHLTEPSGQACKPLLEMPGMLFTCLGRGVCIIKHLHRICVKCENKTSLIKLKAYRETWKHTSGQQDTIKRIKHRAIT